MTHLIIPGLGGSPAGHWQHWWLREDVSAVQVDQSDWDSPDLDAWSATLANAIEDHPGAVLVAHSLGCALVAHLSQSRSDLDVGGALLVAPADVDDRLRISARIDGFRPMPLERLPFPAIVVGSSNDPFVSIGRAMLFSHAWGARFVHLRDSGHINLASGFGAWPDGLRLARRLSREVRRRPVLKLIQTSTSGFCS